jgi:hypothetical protein
MAGRWHDVDLVKHVQKSVLRGEYGAARQGTDRVMFVDP